MTETLRFEIITPQATISFEDVTMVTLPVAEGQIGVYPLHVRLITQVMPGEIILNRGAEESFFAVGASTCGACPPTRFVISKKCDPPK